MRDRRLELLKRILLTEWPQRLTAIMSGLFLYQFVTWIEAEATLWLPQTVALTGGTLWIVGLSCMIPRLRLRYRLLLQFAALLVYHGIELGYTYAGLPAATAAGVKQWLLDNVGQLSPFIWFSFSAWLLYLLLLKLAQHKLNLYMLIVASVLFFAIRDSFSLLVLWPQVTMVLFCGLSLLIVRHIAQLKSRAPGLWDTLAEYPASMGMPVVLIFSVIFILGALAPSINPLLTDPYTAWKHSRGEVVPVMGKGGSAIVSDADATSGYSRKDGKLGGGFRFDFTPVMTVNTTKRTYFRGETRSLYTGQGWEQSSYEKSLPLSEIGGGTLNGDPQFDTSLLKTKEVRQIVQMTNEQTYPVLFGGFPLRQVEELNNGETGFQSLRWSPRQSELLFMESGNYPKSYIVVTEEPVLDEAGLRQVKPKAIDAADPTWSEYVQLPQQVPERVRQLAQTITQNAENPYDKAKSIEKYLVENYPYTNTPNESKGVSSDFVDRFLFEIKEGYCDYYSTSMVVLARSVGLPARWVKGYSSGQSPIPEEIQNLGGINQFRDIDVDAAGVYTVRNADAHSWVEVYFDGYGWISFEPTSGFSLPNMFPEDQPKPVEDLSIAGGDIPAAADSSSRMWGFVWKTGAAVAAAGLIVAAWIAAVRSGRLRAWSLPGRRRQAATFNQKIVVEFEKLLRLGRKRGFTRKEHETMREAAARWAEKSKWMKKDLEAALRMFELAKYSQVAFTEQEFAAAAQTIARLKEQMK